MRWVFIRRIAAKEIRSTLRDRRAILSNLLLPLLLLPLVMLGLPLLMGGLFERETTTVTEVALEGAEHLPDELRRLLEAQALQLVPVSSARTPGAVSEIEVPACHTKVHHHPLTVAELKRILAQHLQETGLANK